MDNTLDSIRPSYVTNEQEEMSYLFGRDPSILAYSQRPFPLRGIKKNLIGDYEVEEYNSTEERASESSDLQSLQTVKVYLRMKPFPKKLKITPEQQDAYRIINSTTLCTRLPALDSNASCLKRSNSIDIVCRKFTFTQTFGPETTQLELFDQAVKQHMIDFLAGQNSTIMTYGTTNSGKSYTLQGTTTSPGIIPRGLEFVFSNITPKSTPSYKPVHHCDIVTLDPIDRAQELEIKTKLLTFASVDKHQYINAYKEMQKLLQEESPMRPSHCNDAHYSVWVSFAEIYNETMYDLLSNECQKKRTPLKLATDSQGRAFIKGLKTVCVSSGSEAYQVLMAGQYNLKVAATALNARSSRSHCIFTIKLLKYYVENNPESVEVSTFAFCDLAGSERLKKTLNIGDRLKEAQNINTSLLVLGRCLKTIHEGQMAKQKLEHIGPFRESKLTRLFQKALSGKEHIALIVNINPLPNLYIETQNVLSFSAIAKKIVIEQKERPQKKAKSRFSQIVTQSIKTVTDWDATELESEEWENAVGDTVTTEFNQAEDYEYLLTENESLKKEIAILKSTSLTRDLEIRQQMADTYTALMKDLEADWKNRIKDVEEQQEDALQWSVRQVEQFYKQKLEQISSRKRRRSSVGGNDHEESQNFQELEIENTRLTSKVVLLKNKIKELKETNQAINVDKNKLAFELGLVKEDLASAKNLLEAAQKDVCSDKDEKAYMEELKSQLLSKQEQVKKLKVFLDEAKEEYIGITTEMREKEYLLKEQDEQLFEHEERIEELEGHLEHTNHCLAEKTKAVEILEEKLESQGKEILYAETKLQDMQAQINKLESENRLLRDKEESIEELSAGDSMQHLGKNDKTKNSEDSTKDESYELLIKEELPSDFGTDILDKTSEDMRKVIETEDKDIKSDLEMKEKIVTIETENSALKERLAQSMIEIEKLKEDLDSAKVKLTDICEQIRKLEPNNTESKTNSNELPNHRVADILVDTSCQGHVQVEETKEVQTNENELESRSCQTVEILTKEKINQTSFTEQNDDNHVVDEWTKLIVKYDDLQTLYADKCLRVEELKEVILSLNAQIECFAGETARNKVEVEEYKNSIELLQKELSLIKEDKKQIEQSLQRSDSIKIDLEKKLVHYQLQLSEAEKNHNQSLEKLKSAQEELDSHLSKCKNEYEQTITELQKELSLAKEKNNIKTQCLDVHSAKIVQLEQSLESVGELQQKINDSNEHLKLCQSEKVHLQKLLDENNEKILDLEDRLENAEAKEREKDSEINSLQKEIKNMIQKYDNNDKDDKLMENEVKDTIRHLADTREMLSRKQDQIENLELRLKTYEQNAIILDLLKQGAEERQAELERLRNLNEELKRSLNEKEHEMETFMKNRDETVEKYETLVKSQQEELEKQKKEFTNLKKHCKEKDYCDNTSEDEVMLKERRTRRAPRKCQSPSKQDVSIIELSGSESKRSGRGTFAAPSSEPSSEKKRNTRKKKLFVTEDELYQEIEPLESTITINPSPHVRSLRSRRK